MVVMDLVCSTDIFNLQASDIEPYKVSFVAWLSDVVNQENIHKLFHYVAMFDELVDHSNCCGFVHNLEQKVEISEQKIDEIGKKLIETITKPRKTTRKSASTKKT